MNRYLVATGNWNSTAVWSATDGGASGASVPGSSDIVYINANYTVTITADVTIGSLQQFSGVINLGGYTLNSNQNVNCYSGVRTINFQGGTLKSTGTIDFGNSNQGDLTLDGTGLLVIDVTETSFGTFRTNSKTFNAVKISVGLTMSGTDYSTRLDIIGSPTFNTLDIRSANTATHTINLQSSQTINTKKLVLSGNTTNKLKLISSTAGTPATISVQGPEQIVAAQNIDLKDITVTGPGIYYAGSTSTNSGGNTGWLFSDAPKVETLIDNFSGTNIDSTKWTVSGIGLTQTGGQLQFGYLTAEVSAELTAKNQFLGQGSSISFKATVSSTVEVFAYFSNALKQYGVSARRNIPDIYVRLTQSTGTFNINANTSYTSTSFSNTYSYYRIREASGTIYLDGSNDGIAYTNVKSAVGATYGLDTTQLIARPHFYFNTMTSGGYTYIDDFNVQLEPTAQFTATPTSGTTPLVVNFTDQSNFAPTSWLWNFGDSTTSTLQNPSKTYSTPGTYTVSLQSSNSSYTRSVTKSNLITASPNVYSRSIDGTLLFGGSVARKLLATRSLSGTLIFGGSVRAVVLRDVEGIQDKRYLYKVYDEDGTYIEVLNDVINEPTFTQEINTTGSEMTLELARNSDSLGITTSPLLDESNQPILTEDDQQILVNSESKNQIGSGSAIDYNNRIDITVFYGSVEPLLTEDNESILTENDEEILADVGAPNGRRIFTGFISEINSRYGSTETTTVKLSSYGWDLDQYEITNSSGETTVTFNTYDPSNIVKDAIDKFITDSAPYYTYTTRTITSIQTTGTTVSYTFKTNTYKEVLDKVLELMPSNWYYYIGLGDNIVYYGERQPTPHHLFYLGKHIKGLDLRGSILDSTNRILYVGGGDPALYIERSAVPAGRTRRTLDIMNDSRVTVQASAEIIADNRIESNNKPLFRTSLEILTKQYDIESINVGDTVGFRNFDNYVDELTMQVLGLTYTPDTIQLQLETKPPTISKRVEDIVRQLRVNDNQNVPAEPV